MFKEQKPPQKKSSLSHKVEHIDQRKVKKQRMKDQEVKNTEVKVKRPVGDTWPEWLKYRALDFAEFL